MPKVKDALVHQRDVVVVFTQAETNQALIVAALDAADLQEHESIEAKVEIMEDKDSASGHVRGKYALVRLTIDMRPRDQKEK